jgi:hypothetical protein
VTVPAACAGGPDSPYPERNYSGEYAAVVTRAENDCRSQGFAPGDSLTAILHQAQDNRATVVIPPIATLQGAFAGDRLVARSAVQPPELPPAPDEPARAGRGAAAAPEPDRPAESAGDSIRYVLDLAFEDDHVEGEYRIDQPAIPGWLDACSQRFVLRGARAAAAPAPVEIPLGER